MQLVVHISRPADTDHMRALSWARQAPCFITEWIDDRKVATAFFPSLPHGIETALQVVGECVSLTGAWASINGRAISSLTRLWQRLDCYRASLGAEDPLRYCLDKSALFNTLVGAGRIAVPCVPIYLSPLYEDATGGSGALGEPSIQGGGRIGRDRLVSAITLAGCRGSAIGRRKTIARSFDGAIVFAAPQLPNGVQPPPTSPFVSSTKNSPFMCV